MHPYATTLRTDKNLQTYCRYLHAAQTLSLSLTHTHTHTHAHEMENLRGGLTKTPQVKWIESNEMYWEDRYVKGCCWQLLLLPRWLVPNDRPAEKGAFDNAATTIHQILVSLQSIYIQFLHCCRHWSRVKASWAVLQARMWNALCFFLWAMNCCLKNSISSTFGTLK